MTKEDQRWRLWVILCVFLNAAATVMNLHIGGWNMLVAPFSYAVALLYAYEWGKLS